MKNNFVDTRKSWQFVQHIVARKGSTSVYAIEFLLCGVFTCDSVNETFGIN